MLRYQRTYSRKSENSGWLLLAVAWAAVWCLFHLVVIGPGATELWDESRFMHCAEAAHRLLDGDISTAVKFSVSGTQARPLACVTWVPHMIVYETLLNYVGPEDAVKGALVGNFVWWILLVLLVFEIAILCFDLTPASAFVVTVLLGGFFSASVNVKHFFPYDASVVLSLSALVMSHRLACSPPLKALVLGVGASCAFLTYPGYYFVYLLLAANALHPRVRRQTTWNMSLLWYSLGAFLPLAALEVWAAVGGLSLSAGLRHLSGTISVGSYQESLSFPFKYAVNAEGELGILVLLLVGLSGLSQIGSFYFRMRDEGLKSLCKEISLGDVLLGTVAVSVLLHSLFGYFFHLFVWYRRLLHLFVPWIAIAVVHGIEGMRPRVACLCRVCVVIVSVLSVSQHIVSLSRIGYPRDVLVALGQTGNWVNRDLEGSLLGCWSTTVDWRYSRSDVRDDPRGHPDLFLWNFCSGFLSDSDFVETPPSASKPIISIPHYESLQVYQYDGIDPSLRSDIWRLSPRIEVFRFEDVRALQEQSRDET